MKTRRFAPSRRDVLRGLAAAGAATALPLHARAQSSDPDDRRFLIVLTCTGGASIIDSMLAVRESECADAATLNAYPDGMVQGVDGTPFRAIDQRLDDIGPLPYEGQATQSDFVRRHAQDMCVFTYTGTSVNHLIAEKRALTGNDAWAGRTVQEVVAAVYGQGLAIPNVNMGSGGFIEPGIDPSLPDYARGEPVIDALTWSLGLHGTRGVGLAPPKDRVALARAARARIEARSNFEATFGGADLLQQWRTRREAAPSIEGADLISRLSFLPDNPALPLGQYGLAAAPDAARVREAFPLYLDDPMEAQAALAYLLIKNGISVTVTIGPNSSPVVGGQQIVDSPPLAFDFSHSAHRGTQALMWSRLLSVADRLIGLLSEVEYKDGESYWDRSMIYFASDFGRTRNRSSGAREFGSGHHLNNGCLVVSPMVKGNTVLGGVDPNTLMTYGFDPRTGDPEPGREMTEPDLFAGIVQTLGVDTAGTTLPDMKAMRRG